MSATQLLGVLLVASAALWVRWVNRNAQGDVCDECEHCGHVWGIGLTHNTTTCELRQLRLAITKQEQP